MNHCELPLFLYSAFLFLLFLRFFLLLQRQIVGEVVQDHLIQALFAWHEH